MATKTRTDITTNLITLADAGQPKISKTTFKTFVQQIVDGYLNRRSDSWPDPVRGLFTAPPGSPSIGDRYAIAAFPSGAWASNAGDIAEWDGSSWVLTTHPLGTIVQSRQDAEIQWVRIGSRWKALHNSIEEVKTLLSGTSVTGTDLGYINAMQVQNILNARIYAVEMNLMCYTTNIGDDYQVSLDYPAGTACWQLLLPGEPVRSNNDITADHSGTSPNALTPFMVTVKGVISPTADGSIHPYVSGGSGTSLYLLRGSSIKVTDITSGL